MLKASSRQTDITLCPSFWLRFELETEPMAWVFNYSTPFPVRPKRLHNIIAGDWKGVWEAYYRRQLQASPRSPGLLVSIVSIISIVSTVSIVSIISANRICCSVASPAGASAQCAESAEWEVREQVKLMWEKLDFESTGSSSCDRWETIDLTLKTIRDVSD